MKKIFFNNLKLYIFKLSKYVTFELGSTRLFTQFQVLKKQKQKEKQNFVEIFK